MYTQQVETANAIEVRLHEMAAEMVEEQQSIALKKAVRECYEVVVFDVSMQSWL